MGSYEIFPKSSDNSIEDIVEIKTPSPLTSSHSSDSCKSLLIGINELTSGLSTRRVEKLEDSSTEEAEEEKYLKRIKKLNEDSRKKEDNEEILSDSENSSLESSPSSLKRRLRNLPSPNEDIRLVDHVAALDRRISRERDVYLQLQELADRIEEKDEVESNSLTDSKSIPKLHLDHSQLKLNTNMCSSAPETMRSKPEVFEQKLPNITTCFKKQLTKNFNERRPPKYLQPLEVPVKEILRCNAPPLCLSDKKISELLRRGSISAREEYLKKSKNPPTKLLSYRKPTGVIIKNFSSGSEDDFTNQLTIRDSNVTKIESEIPVLDNSNFRSQELENKMPSSIPEETLTNKDVIENQRDDYLQFSKSAKTVQKSSINGEDQLNGDAKILDDSSTSGSKKLIKGSLDNRMTKLKNILKDIDSDCREIRPLNVPKLEIQSQDYSHSTSQTSREDSTKKSLDVNALIRALSDVSIKHQEIVERKIQTEINDSVLSRSIEPKSSAYTSVANGSRQSMISIENELQEAKNNYLKSLHFSRDFRSDLKKINHRDSDKEIRKKIIEESKKIVGVPLKKSYKCRSTNFIEVKKCPVKLIKIDSPEIKKNRIQKCSEILKNEATIQNESFRIARNHFQSYDSLMQKCKKLDKNEKLTIDSSAVLSEPVTSRKDEIICKNHSSFINDQSSLDDKFKYLERGSKISYKRSSSSSCDSTNKNEEIEFKPKIISQTMIGSQIDDQLKNEAKFTIYEDTIEASPRSKENFPTEKFNTVKSSSRTSKYRRELHRSGSTSTYVNDDSVSKEPNPSVSSPKSKDCKNFPMNDKENFKNVQNSEIKNIFWADSSVELNRAMNCSLESNHEVENSSFPDAQSCLISPSTSSKKKSNFNNKRSPKIFSVSPSILEKSKGSPKYKYDEETSHGKNLAAESFKHFQDSTEKKIKNENIFSSFAVAKRLSYSELQDSHLQDDNSDKVLMPEENFHRENRKILSSEEFIDDVASNCSQTNLAITGKSDGNVHQFKKAFDRVTTRPKTSSSLSKLNRSPVDKNIASRRKSQERFPFTISESTSAKSSSKFRVENAIPVNSDCEIIEQSETAYKLRIHPSLLRLANSGIEDKPEEIIRSVTSDMIVKVERRNFLTKFVGKFSSKLKKSRKCEKKSCSGGTKVIYENKKCRASSVDESSGSETTEKPSRRFNRNGFWVEGLQNEIYQKNVNEENQFHDTELQISNHRELIDKYTNFLIERERLKKQFNKEDFAPRTPMNSLINNEDSDFDPGCFCLKIHNFLIGGKFHSPKRSSLFRRAARRSKHRRRF